MSVNITSKEWENGELVESDERITIDGRFPGGEGGFWFDDDGTLKPANDKPVGVKRASIAAEEFVSPDDDFVSIYQNAAGPVKFGPGDFELDSAFQVVPGKPIIAHPSPPDDPSVGTRFTPSSSFSDSVSRLFEVTSDGTQAESHFHGIFGAYIDCENTVERGVEMTNQSRHALLRYCTIRNATDYALSIGGSGTTVRDCYIEDSGLDNNKYAARVWGGDFFQFLNCEFITCYGGLKLNVIDGGCRIAGCRFANHQTTFLDISESTGREETSLTIANTDFVDFDQAVNAIQATSGFPGPLKIADCHFDGLNRETSAANGNKAFNTTDTFPRGLVFQGNTARNFTNAPWFAFRDALADAQVNGNDPRPAWDVGTVTVSSGATGVQTTTLDGVITREDARTPEVIVRPDTDTTPAADYGIRTEPPDFTWDESQGAVDVTLRINLVTDPGSNFDVEYEVVPPAE